MKTLIAGALALTMASSVFADACSSIPSVSRFNPTELSERQICFVNEYRADDQHGVLGSLFWVRVNDRIYSTQISRLANATDSKAALREWLESEALPDIEADITAQEDASDAIHVAMVEASKLTAANAEIAELKENVSFLESEIEALEAEVAHENAKWKHYQRRFEDEKAISSKWKNKYFDMKADYTASQLELAETKLALAEEKAALVAMTANYEAADKAFKAAQDKLDSIEAYKGYIADLSPAEVLAEAATGGYFTGTPGAPDNGMLFDNAGDGTFEVIKNGGLQHTFTLGGGLEWSEASLDSINEIIEDAYDAGYGDGYDKGYADGYADGFKDGVDSVK